MITTKYYKDFRHNFLILKEDEREINIYQSRMITENKIKGLLSCRERHIDGERLLYYDITSKQNLASLYEYGHVSLSFVRRIFRQLKAVNEEMSGYLLSENCLLLKPEFIFADVEKQEFLFLYFPYEAEENYMLSLVEFLTDKMDAEDREGMDVCYKLLQLIEKEQFVLDEVIQWFEDDLEAQDSGKQFEDTYKKRQVQHYAVEDAWEDENFYEKESKRERTCQKEKGNLNGKNKMAKLFMVTTLPAAGILYYIHQNGLATGENRIYFYAAVIAVVVVFLMCAVYLLISWVFTEKGLITIPSFGMGKEKEKAEERKYRETEGYEQEEGCERDSSDYGNTVFIPWVENCENKLYGMGKGNRNHIDLNRLPITVGKLAGSVDMVIPDQSLSRRHVKFSREGNRICMTDLNSTNGTFLNGLRLEPNTSEMLEPGDEIRLGKLKFIYR